MQPGQQQTGDRTHATRAFMERLLAGRGAITPGQPTSSAQTPPRGTSLPTGGGGGTPQFASQGGVQQLQKSQPGEAEIIIKALIQRLRSLTPTGGGQGGTNVTA